MSPRGNILTLSDKRITRDQRISVERPFMTDWNLHIRQVNLSDSGEYLCQINTKPVKSKKILLHINGKYTVILHCKTKFYTTQSLIGVKCLFSFTGHTGNLTPKHLL